MNATTSFCGSLRRSGYAIARSVVTWFASGLIVIMAAASADASAVKLLSPDAALYGRAIRIRHWDDREVLATVTSFTNGTHVGVYASHAGKRFTELSRIDDPEFAGGLCCGTLFELPRTVGVLPRGTLLWAGSVGQSETNRRMKIKVYRSSDAGRTWSYLNEIVSPNIGGLWEPEFTVASDGALVMFYSDETQSAYSQFLNQVRSYDGTTWQDASRVVASTNVNDRPGMAIVSKLVSGDRIMTFELCGPSACAAHYKLSRDGWNWGDPADLGASIRLPDGRFFEHAPTNAVLPDGSILLVGQVLVNADNSVASANGRVIFKNVLGNPIGRWYPITAPVPVPDAYDNYCPNYSSSLLPSETGSSVLELANDYSSGQCLMFYNEGPAQ